MNKSRITFQFYYGMVYGLLCALAGQAGYGEAWVAMAVVVIMALIVYFSFMSRLYGKPENSERVGSDY